MAMITKTFRMKGSSKTMAHRPRGPEKIRMYKRRYGYFPEQFTWRGRRYDVHAVERCWTVSRKRLGNRVDRLYFRLRCAASEDWGRQHELAVQEGTFDVYHDLNTNTWHLANMVSETC
jgi:hypothetical protein